MRYRLKLLAVFLCITTFPFLGHATAVRKLPDHIQNAFKTIAAYNREGKIVFPQRRTDYSVTISQMRKGGKRVNRQQRKLRDDLRRRAESYQHALKKERRRQRKGKKPLEEIDSAEGKLSLQARGETTVTFHPDDRLTIRNNEYEVDFVNKNNFTVRYLKPSGLQRRGSTVMDDIEIPKPVSKEVGGELPLESLEFGKGIARFHQGGHASMVTPSGSGIVTVDRKKRSVLTRLETPKNEGAPAELTQVQQQFAQKTLERRDFTLKELTHFDFHDARLREVSFGGSRLQGANFRGAKIEQSYFNQVDARGASFEGATFIKVNFANAHFDDTTNFLNARADRYTVWPTYLDLESGRSIPFKPEEHGIRIVDGPLF